MNLNDLAMKCYETSSKNGFYDNVKHLYVAEGFANEKREEERLNAISTKLMLIVSEAAEAVESLREGNFDAPLDTITFKQVPGIDLPKPEGFASELADIIIRTLDTSWALGIDIQDAVESKMAFNSLRSKKHGKAF